MDGMGWVGHLGEVLQTLSIFLERKSVDLFAAGMRTEAGKAECSHCSVVITAVPGPSGHTLLQIVACTRQLL